jgi:hypothetical protein
MYGQGWKGFKYETINRFANPESLTTTSSGMAVAISPCRCGCGHDKDIRMSI